MAEGAGRFSLFRHDPAWWREIIREPRQVADGIVGSFGIEPNGWKGKVVSALLLIGAPLFLPIVLALLAWVQRPSRALKRLRAKVDEMWPTAPEDAAMLLQKVHLALSGGVVGGSPPARVQIDPFGTFHQNDLVQVTPALLNADVLLGYHDEAISLLATIPNMDADMILAKVRWLIRMGREKDAVALLEEALTLDNRRGDLRRRLAELTGGTGRGLN